jgi:magnesium chelatase family protein
MHDRPVAVGSAVIWGVDAVPVTIEATMRSQGSPRILGQVDHVVREAYHRIMSAFSADGLERPRGSPTVNFVPAHIRKTGSGFDLPMALALAGAAGLFPPGRVTGLTALGEIALDGAVLTTRGAVAVALAAAERGWTRMLTSPWNAPLAAVVPGVQVYPVRRLRDALLWLRGDLQLEPARPLPPPPAPLALDLADIRGHETPKTALVAAAAGRHNLLFSGPPGSGKTALLRRLRGLLPPTTGGEALDILKIHTAHGGRPGSDDLRPVRAPHHSSSHVSLLGGGPDPRPGEVTLAHHGVLFLDEVAEFRREALEGLRQPLEDGSITIGRALRTATMPADFLLAATMNPCPCGYFGHAVRPCVCSRAQRHRYRSRVSGPLLDRIDLQVEVPAHDPETRSRPPDPAWSTAVLRHRVLGAVERQARRNRGPHGPIPNGRLADRALERAVGADAAVLGAVEEVLRTQRLSGRARVRLLRIARTLADLAERDEVRREDVLAAARLRGLERTWGD